MDFDLDFETGKEGNSAVDMKKDHSQAIGDSDGNNGGGGVSAGDLSSSNTNTKASNSSDDFEHIIKDKTDFDFIGGIGKDSTAMQSQQHNLFDSDPIFNDPLTKPISAVFESKNDDFDLLGTLNPVKTATIDFMASERNSSPAKTTASQQATKSIYDEIENDYLNPYASSKSNEKFISSEDLLSDFKDELPSAASTKIIDFEPPSSPPQPSIKPVPAEPDIFSKSFIKDSTEILPAKLEEKITPAKITKAEPVPKPVKPSSKPISSSKPRDQMISAEEIFYRIGLDAWFKPERLHPKVESLIYWRDPKKSGIVFGAGIAVLLAISFFSVISVIAYVSLTGLIVTMAVRIYKNVLQAVQKTSEGHPFKEYLEYELALPQEKVQQIANVGVVHVNAFLAELRRLFLVEDLVDSIKFALLLWCLTYLGSWFNGMTLVILGFVALFTLPKVYENNKQSIDTYLDLVRSKVLEITEKVKTAVPIGGKKQESDKDK